jgi:23S rRNA (cytosine1962-C5)-methyltransferase
VNRANPPRVTVLRRGADRLRLGHPWVYRDDIADHGGAGHGEVVQLRTRAGDLLGYAFYSSRSKIAVRRILGAEEPPDERFWRSQIDRALRYREQVAGDAEACRLVFGESDGIPGLVVDRYGCHLVIQVLTAGAGRLLETVLRALQERLEIASVLARNDASVRRLEDLPRETTQIAGTTPPFIEIQEDKVRLAIDPWRGQKTGAFLDQRENRILAARLARGRVLDVFCYQGAFAMHLASAGLDVQGVDASADAIDRARQNAALNALSDLRFCVANAFENLRERERQGQRFDCVLLDPPAFAKSRLDLPDARRGYKEINLRAMRLLDSGGILVTSSCSYNLGETDFLEVLAEAAGDAKRSFRVLEKRTQAKDHPILLGFPESHYLKCLFLMLT